MSDDWALLLKFDTDNEEFVRGFEAGRVWALLQDDDPHDMTVHASNAEMMLRLAEGSGREVHSEEHEDGWITVWFSMRQEVTG